MPTARKTAEPKPQSGEQEVRAPGRLQVIDVDGTKVAVYDPDATAMWARLTEPFPADWVEKLPKPVKGKDDNKGRCDDQSPYYSADGHFCGGWHARAVHLDYVGHAGITMRLNSVLGPDGWAFRPLAADPQTGQPILTRDTFWGALTILGHTHVDVAANFNSPQEAYGDALRRCAMRFGMGTYLWSKSDQALAQAQAAEAPEPPPMATGGNVGHESDPDLYAPNGQPWRHADGSANPDALAPHQRAVFDMIGTLTPDESKDVTSWWASNQVPNTRHLTEDQAKRVLSYLQTVVDARPPA